MVVPEARQTTFDKAVAREAPQQAAKLYGADALEAQRRGKGYAEKNLAGRTHSAEGVPQRLRLDDRRPLGRSDAQYSCACHIFPTFWKYG